MKRFEILAEEVPYQGFFRLIQYRLRHSLFAGGMSQVLTRELFCRTNCVAVVPYDPARDQVVLIEQFRVGTLRHPEDQKWMLEIVAGAIEEGETPEQVAHRETWEEAGCKILNLVKATEFYTSPGSSSEKITLFLAQVDAQEADGIHGLSEEHEDIKVHVVPFTEALAKVGDGTICSAIPIIGLLWLARERDRLRKLWTG
ncbi:MAG: NUDIX domain-containing protein [Methylohalobius sp.]|nr:NUDIX domain-containing protein [Methylohalobius sp.]